MADARHCAEAHHHFLVNHQHGNEKGQGPQQAVTEVLPGLGVGGDATRVVIAHHHNEAGADDGKEGQDARTNPLSRRSVVADGAECTGDLVIVVGHGSPFVRQGVNTTRWDRGVRTRRVGSIRRGYSGVSDSPPLNEALEVRDGHSPSTSVMP